MNRQRNTFVTATQIHRDLIAVTIIVLLLVSVTFAGQWPRLRGPHGQGINDAKTIPVKWTQSDYNWKIELSGTGPSSPVVWDDKVFVTCAAHEYELLAVNSLGVKNDATPAVADERMYLRTSSHLVCLEGTAKQNLRFIFAVSENADKT